MKTTPPPAERNTLATGQVPPLRTPGQQLTGRFSVVEDLQRFGLQAAMDLLCSEGCVGLFAHTLRESEDFAAALQGASIQATPHAWDLYHAQAAELQAAAHQVLSTHGPMGTDLLVREDWGAQTTQQCQALMQQCGVMPASQEVLRGQLVPSLIAIAFHATGQIAGVGSLVWGHCPQGSWRGYAHLGMVCVDSQARGQSLGKRLAAALVWHGVQRSGTAGITAACASDNLASASLLQACGLRRDGQRLCILFTQDGQRRTR